MTLSLDDICEAIVDCEHKTAPISPDGIPSVRTSNIRNGVVDFASCNRVTEETYAKWTQRREPKPGDIILAREAPVGEVGIIPPGQRACLGQRTVLISPDRKQVDPDYLCYLLVTREMKHEMICRAEGSTVPHLNMSDIRGLLLPPLPTLPKQIAVANILRTLDDKIELNRRMNETLESMARALFKSWFVDFDPVRAKMDGHQPPGLSPEVAALFPDKLVHIDGELIPEGWKPCTLGDLANNASITFDFSTVDDVVFVNTGDVLNGDFLHATRSPKVGLPGQAKKTIKIDDILYSEIRPANRRFAYVDFESIDYVVSTKFMIIRSLGEIHPRLLYRHVTSDAAIAEFQMLAESRSGTFPQITFDTIRHLPIVLPTVKIQNAYQEIVDLLDSRIKANKNETASLSKTRDTLLPKLLSGELRVADAEKQLS